MACGGVLVVEDEPRETRKEALEIESFTVRIS